MKNLFLILTSLLFCITSDAQIKRVPLSPLQVLKQSIGNTDITLTYSRPAIRDRKIFGGLVPFDQKWRTGANRNSKIEFSENVMIGDSLIKAGAYVIITIPTKDDWEVFLYDDITNWEVPEPWNEDLVVVSLKVPSETIPSTVQSMTFSFDDITYADCKLSLLWEQTKITIPIKIKTEEQMMKVINKTLDGPAAGDFYLAALYREGTSVELEQGLEWIDTAIELRDPDRYWDYLLKSKILVKLNRIEAAHSIAKQGLEIANDYGYKYGIKLLKQQVADTKG